MNRITNVAELYTITEDRTTVTYKDIGTPIHTHSHTRLT